MGFLSDVGIYATVHSVAHVHHLPARCIAFVGAASQNWLLNRRFTFVHARETRPFSQWVAFLSMMTVGFALNVGTYAALTMTVQSVERRYGAFVLGITVATTWNFLSARAVVFKVRTANARRRPARS